MKPNVLVSTRGLSREDWLEYRTRGIGGSDIPAILGLTPRYRTAIDVWMEKTGRQLPSTSAPFVVNGEEYPSEAAYWGTVHETAVAAHFAALTGFTVKRRNAILQHPEHLIMLANLDREVVDDSNKRGGLECKATSAFLIDDWDAGRVPLPAQCQSQWYMGVTGYPYWYVAALIGGNKFAYAKLERDDEVIAGLIAAAEEFWGYVIADTMPPVDGSNACSAAIDALYPRSSADVHVELPPIYLDDIERRGQLRAQIADLDTELAAIENRIKSEMGEAESAICGDYTVNWKTVISNRLDSKALKAAHPGIHGEFCKESVSRRFEIKKARTA